MTLKRTQKREDEVYNELYNNAVRRVRGMLPPQSIAQALYPHLPSANDQPKAPQAKKEK